MCLLTWWISLEGCQSFLFFFSSHFCKIIKLSFELHFMCIFSGAVIFFTGAFNTPEILQANRL